MGISVDPPERNAAMVEKLGLPFALLSDPDGERAIKPYGVWHEEPEIARPAIVLVGPDGTEAFRRVAEDFADRSPEDEVVDRVKELRLGSVDADEIVVGPTAPGEKAFPAEALKPYFRGARFSALSIGGRVPEAKDTTDQLVQQADRYLEAWKAVDSG